MCKIEELANRTEILRNGLVRSKVKNLQNGRYAVAIGQTKAEAIERAYQKTLWGGKKMNKNNLEKLDGKLIEIYRNMELIYHLSDVIIQEENHSEDLQDLCEKVFEKLDSLLEN